MPDHRVCRMTLVDAMILVAAAAVGLTVFQVVNKLGMLGSRLIVANLFEAPPDGWRPIYVIVRAQQVLEFLLPIVASWTMAVPLLRLRKPRRAWRRVARAPGMVACLAALAGLVWCTLGAASGFAISRGFSRWHLLPAYHFMSFFVTDQVFADIGLAVAVAWAVLAVSGRWRPACDWHDRLGRVLGIAWLIIGLVWTCRRYPIL